MYKLFELFEKHYASGIVLFICVGFLLVSIFSDFNKVLDILKKIFKRKSKKAEISIDDLKRHYIFTHIKYLKNIKINLLNFGDPGRNYLIKLLITHKLNYIEKNLLNMIETTDFEHINNYDLENRIIQLYNDSICLYLENFEKEAHTPEEQIVVKLVIDTLWAKYNDPQSDFGIKGIQDVISSTIYTSNILKVHSLLLPLMISLDAFLIRCEKALYGLNGQLTGKTFHGITFK
jgi:hypothetical protein